MPGAVSAIVSGLGMGTLLLAATIGRRRHRHVKTEGIFGDLIRINCMAYRAVLSCTAATGKERA